MPYGPWTLILSPVLVMELQTDENILSVERYVASSPSLTLMLHIAEKLRIVFLILTTFLEFLLPNIQYMTFPESFPAACFSLGSWFFMLYLGTKSSLNLEAGVMSYNRFLLYFFQSFLDRFSSLIWNQWPAQNRSTCTFALYRFQESGACASSLEGLIFICFEIFICVNQNFSSAFHGFLRFLEFYCQLMIHSQYRSPSS